MADTLFPSCCEAFIEVEEAQVARAVADQQLVGHDADLSRRKKTLEDPKDGHVLWLHNV